MGAVFKRELKGYFISPIGYLVIGLYAALYIILFHGLYQVGLPQVSMLFNYSFILTLFLMPILTMRSFSEERRQKTDQALLTAPETRSSSPVRILRGESLQSAVHGLYPCGEGAGYAGGILSAAVDGMLCAEAVLRDTV